MLTCTKRVTFSLVIIFCAYLCMVHFTNVTAFAGGMGESEGTNYQEESSMNSSKYESTTEAIQQEPSYDSSGTDVTKVYSDESLFNASDQNNGTQSYSVCYNGDNVVVDVDNSNNTVIIIIPPEPTETTNPPNQSQDYLGDFFDINSGQSVSDVIWGVIFSIISQILGAILNIKFRNSVVTKLYNKFVIAK